MTIDLLSDLNPAQRSGVTLSGFPLLILAGPGSGKTRVVTRRIAYAVQHRGVRPNRILAVTFTNRATAEMQSRVRHLLGEDAPVRIGTFHALGNAILRRHIRRLGWRRDFRLLTSRQARQCVAVLPAAQDIRAADLSEALSAIKNGATVRATATKWKIVPQLLETAMRQYEEALRDQNAVDIDDLVYLAVKVLDQEDDLRRSCQAAYDEFLVDEYQDINPAQHALVKLLMPRTRNLTVVGDEDQAIYGWRQADVGTIMRFHEEFPDSQVIFLEQSYRSSKLILRAAQALIEHNRDRYAKGLFTENGAGDLPMCFCASDEADEANWIAETICWLHSEQNRSWKDFAVLYRVNTQSRALEDAFVRRGVPYRIHAGGRFYDLPEVRHVISLLRLALDSTDDGALSDLLGSIDGIGPRRLDQLRIGSETKGITLLEGLTDPSVVQGLPGTVVSQARQLAEQIERLGSKRLGSLPSLIDDAILLEQTRLAARSAAEREDANENLAELRAVLLDSGPRATLRSVVDRVSIERPEGAEDDAVSCLSLHAAKGLEFPVVFLSGLEEGLLPHRRSVDPEGLAEERRLCFVGMTRAQEQLYLSYAHTRLLGGQMLGGGPSRFIAEISPAHLRMQSSPKLKHRPRLFSVRGGERVEHTRWGKGTIVAIEGTGRATLVTVAFDTGARHRVQLYHAPLSRLAEESPHVHTK